MLTHTSRLPYGSLPFHLLPLASVASLFLQEITPEPLPGLGGPPMCTENLSISWHYNNTSLISLFALLLN